MALRVLLADESPTIKKVLQLTLKDYAVEVRSVNIGLDVYQVAKDFRPDIVFIDILLQKKNGYDVALELKSSPEFSKTPLVLMWSGFMDIDKKKFQECHADAKLEKPFEAEELRDLIKKYVPKTQSQSIEQFLDFPPLPEDAKSKTTPQNTTPESKVTPPEESPASSSQRPTSTLSSQDATNNQSLPEDLISPQALGITDQNQKESSWSMDDFAPLSVENFLNRDDSHSPLSSSLEEESLSSDEPPIDPDDNFQALKLEFPFPLESESPKINEDSKTAESTKPNSSTSRTDLNEKSEDDSWLELDAPSEEFRVNIPFDDNLSARDFQLDVDQVLPEMTKNSKAEDLTQHPQTPHRQTQQQPSHTMSPPPQVPQLSEEQLLNIIRAQSQEVIEKVVWQVVPELASQLIQKEIQRLLDANIESSQTP